MFTNHNTNTVQFFLIYPRRILNPHTVYEGSITTKSKSHKILSVVKKPHKKEKFQANKSHEIFQQYLGVY